MILPKAIKPGDTIGVIAPSNIILEKDEEYIEKLKDKNDQPIFYSTRSIRD